jgi:cytochrome c oxidase subunit I+III
VTAVAVVVARCFEYPAVHTKWDTHAYGSVVWTLLGMHTVHLLASTLETIVLTVYSFARPMDAKHRLDLNVNALYWYFVVGTWVPSFAILYFTPRIG